MSEPDNSQIRQKTLIAHKHTVLPSFAFCTVVDAFAHTGTYIVEHPIKGKIAASDMFATTMLPMGARPIGGYSPKSRVMVLTYPNESNAVILGAAPKELDDPRLVIPDSIVLRSRSGQVEDPMHFSVFVSARSSIGNHSAGRPIDSLSGDWGYINDLGLAVFLGRMMTCLKASDGAKIEAFWGDDLLRIVGYNYEFFTSGAENTYLNDEGEYDVVKRSTPYPWEALGIATKGTQTTRTADGLLKPGTEYASEEPYDDKLIIIPRVSEFGGYLGDLSRTIISSPPDELKYETYDSKTVHHGLADVIKSSDGTLINRSAKAIISEKYVLIPVPKQLKAAEDPQGDTPTAGYSPAGSSVPDPEFKWDTSYQSLAVQAQLFDYLAYTINKYTCVGLWKHEKDWYYPEESELNMPVKGATYSKDLTVLSSSFYLELPEVGALKIDSRPQRDSIRYYQSRSIIAQLEDGSIVIEDGYGASIKMGGGHIEISAPGDIWRRPGRSDIVWAPYDAIIRSGNSVDISAAKHDVRIKAEANLQMLGGNGDVGGVLIESKTEGRSTKSDYANDGQSNTSRGITIKSAGACDIIAQQAYIGISGGGVLTFDAGKDGEIFVTGNRLSSRMDNGFSFQVSTEGGNVQNELAITPGGIVVDGLMEIGGQLIMAPTEHSPQADLVVGGNLVCYGTAIVDNGVATNGGYVAFGSPGMVGPLKKKIPFVPSVEKLSEDINTYVDELTKPTDDLTKQIRDDPETAPGNEEYQKAIGFAFRTQDDLKLHEDFIIFESRWQQMLRLGSSGKNTWDEPPVKSGSGNDTLPHPGPEGWKSWESFGQYDPSNFDIASGVSKSRASLKESGSTPAKVELSSGYLVTVKPN